jgi:hypothetical protein
LALAFGRVDVDEFIDSIPPETLREWRAFAMADGWASQWDHTAELMSWDGAQTDRLEAAILATAGVQTDKREPITSDDIRRCWRGKPVKPKANTRMSVDQLKRQRASGQRGY